MGKMYPEIFLSKGSVINAIKSFGEEFELKVTAEKIIERINRMPHDRHCEPIRPGLLKTTFKGLNISFGRCSECKARIVWYTAQPLRGCPHCFVRFQRDGAGNG